jgi:membrane-bound metal-dependent hydrolase YbcI (DUF457 family)
MPSPIAHGFAGYALVVLSEPAMATTIRGNFIALTVGTFFGSLADADFFVAHFAERPELQHHYFSHSIPFALLIGLFMYPLIRWILKCKNPLRWSSLIAIVYGSHLFLDYFTHDGSRPIGIPLLWPLTSRHFMAPIEIFMSIHRGSRGILFGPHNMEAILQEACIMAPVAFAAFLYARQKELTAKTPSRV